MHDRRLPQLDALRGIAIVAVVGLHVSFGFLRAAPPASGTATAALTMHMLTAFGTPLFVALSMAGMALGYGPLANVGAYGSFLARRARRVLPGYFFWTVLTLLRDHPTTLVQPVALARDLATGSAAYHLYFVPLICEYYVAWPLLARLALGARRGTSAAIAGSGLALTLLVWRASSIGVLSVGPLMLPLYWLGYALLGIAAAPPLARRALASPRTPSAWIPWTALATVTALVMVRYVHGLLGSAPDAPTLAIATTIFQAPVMAYTLAAMGLAALWVAAPGRGRALLAALGRSSYGVYLAHVLVLEVVVQRVLGRPDALAPSAAALPALVAEWTLCLALTYVLVRAMAAIPALAPFAGAPTDRALTPPAPAP